MEIKELIQDYKNRCQLSNKEIAQRFQVTPMTVGRWLKGEVKSIQEDTARRISEAIGYDIMPLLQGTAITLKKPVLGMVKGGYDMFLSEHWLGEEDVSCAEYAKGDYFLKVSGNSMQGAGIVDGSYIYVKRCREVRNGEIAVIALDDEVTVKRFYKENGRIRLKAEHPAVAERCFSFKEAKQHSLSILGKVLFVKTYLP